MLRCAQILTLSFLGILLFPFVVSADAGFATAPLWISQANPIDDDALKLFVVVNNTSTTTANGTVLFAIDEATVGTTDVSLTAGTAQILSVPWTARVGAHSITATFLGTSAGPLSITVAAAPPKPVVLQYIDTAVNIASPALSGIVQSVENVRQSGADYFATQLGLKASSTTPQGEVLGAKTEVPNKTTSTNPSFFNRMSYLFFSNPLLFYPLVLFSLLLAFWLISRFFSRD